MAAKIVIISLLTAISFGTAQGVSISGRVTNIRGIALSNALVGLQNQGHTTTTGADGRFSLSGVITNISRDYDKAASNGLKATVSNGLLFLTIPVKSFISISTFSLNGELVSSNQRFFDKKTHAIPLPRMGTSVYFCRIATGEIALLFKIVSMGEVGPKMAVLAQGPPSPKPLREQPLAKASFNDILTVSAKGYADYRMAITQYDTSGMEIPLSVKAAELPKFSFFVTSQRALLALSDREDGFGGDLRFGETGPGAGLRGADKICATIAERSMPGSSFKRWRAFLSVKADENGDTVHARDRIGEGPWYDRVGRLVAPTLDDLLNSRPKNGDRTITMDLPNENGIPNRNPDGTGKLYNKPTLTGSSKKGMLY